MSFASPSKALHQQFENTTEKATELDPRYAAAYASLGWTYYLECAWQWNPDPQGLERAFELAQQAVALDDSSSYAHGLLGNVYMRKKQYEQALTEGERAIILDPNHAEAYVWLGNIMNLLGRPQEAAGLTETALRLNPHSPSPYLSNLGWAYLLMGRSEEAIAALKQAVTRSPNYLDAHLLLANSYLQAWTLQWSQDPHTLERAFESVQRALALNDSYSYAHVMLGLIHLWNKQPEEAIAEGKQAMALNPNFAESYVALGQILAHTGRPQEAIGLIETAMRLNPRYPAIYSFNLGLAYNLTGQYEEAIATLKRALNDTPFDLGIHLNLAVAYSELGREEEAQAEAAEVLRLNPQFSLEVMRQRAPYTEPAVRERLLTALRKAGLK